MDLSKKYFYFVSAINKRYMSMMIIPNDIERHPDGSPVLFIEPLHKEMFINWAFAQKIDLEKMSVQERETLFKEWKVTYNPPEVKREWKFPNK